MKRLTALIASAGIAFASTAQAADVKLLNVSYDPTRELYVAINKAFESDQQAVLVHAKLDDNGEELLPGMFIEALIGVDSTQAQSLPSEAVVSNGDDHYVYVEHEANTFLQVPVRTGASELGYTPYYTSKEAALDFGGALRLRDARLLRE